MPDKTQTNIGIWIITREAFREVCRQRHRSPAEQIAAWVAAEEVKLRREAIKRQELGLPPVCDRTRTGRAAHEG